MKKILIICLFACTLSAEAQWRTSTPMGSTINDITFTDDSVGYAVSQGGGIGSCSVGHSIIKTIDGGENWIRMRSGITDRITAIHFANSLVGWIAAESSRVLKTSDGGMTWVQQTSGVGSGYNDIFFIDENTGFVTGNNGMLRRSTNGGNTWTTISSGSTASLNRIYFYDSQLGFVAAQNGTLLRTVNGGNSWTTLNFGANVLRDVVFTSATTGYATGFEGGSPRIWKTEDAGNSWTATVIGFSIHKIVFPTEDTGYIIGLEGELAKTEDAGATWTTQAPPAGSNLSTSGAIFFLNADYGFIGGNRAIISRTFDGGSTWENVNSTVWGDISSVVLPQRDTSYCANTEGRIFRSTNGGVSYRDITPPVTVPINKLYFFNSTTGIAGGINGIIARTANAGRSWSLSPTGSTASISDISFADNSIGYASASGGSVLKTENGGLNWTSLSTGFSAVDFNNVWFVNPDTGFVTDGNQGGAIYRTLDGGSSWTVYDTGPTGFIRDIVFTNDSLGYCMKSQTVFITKNSGTTWQVRSTPSPIIRELFMYNDSAGFATYGTSQASTVDSCTSFFTAFTACFPGNFAMQAIHGTPDGQYALAMGMNGLVNQLDPTEISRVYVNDNTFCPGSTIFVAFHGRGYWDAANVFTAQLSDAAGSFDNPVNIGSYPSTPFIYGSGVITASIPPGTSPGQYRIRVVADNPSYVGPDNGYDIVIDDVVPTVSIEDNLTNPLCQSGSLGLSAVVTGEGANPIFQWELNGNTTGSDAQTLLLDSVSEGDLISVTLISSLACASPNTATATYEVIFDSIETGLMGDTAVCANSELTLQANPNLNYSWTPDTGLDDPTSASPVATITEDITYFLEVSDGFGCTASDSVLISVLEGPQLMSADTIACPGSSVQLSATPGGIYAWSPTAGLSDPTLSNPIATIDSSITYILSATGSEGCTLIDSVRIETFPLPVITLWADSLLCFGDCIEFTPEVNMGIQSATWSPSAQLSNPEALNTSYCAEQDQVFTLTIIDANDCEASTQTTVELHPLPETPTINFDGIILSTVEGTAYQWFLNDVPIEGANDQVYTPLENGFYSVFVTNADGCSALSEVFDLNNLGIGYQKLQGITVYPNPTSGILMIRIDQSFHSFRSMEFTDLSGRRLQYSETFEAQADFSNLASGIYLLRIITNKGIHVERIAVKR